MIGIIIWAILIIFIVICVCPGFLTAFFVISLIVLSAYGLIYGLVYWVKGGCKLESTSKPHTESAKQSYIEIISNKEREKAIAEWERKWGRRHPCRNDH